MVTEFVKAHFCIDSIPSTKFEGYTNGDDWNGFACPFFEGGIAELVLKASEQNGYSWEYVPEDDTFIVRNTADPIEYEPERFEGQIISVGNNEIKVYAIGAYSWIWGECE
jgi:hypothetical protein